jgi:hypothetical protein
MLKLQVLAWDRQEASTCMEGSVLSFLKAEWKVSDTEPLVILASGFFCQIVLYIVF